MRFLFTSDYLNLANIGGAGRVLIEAATRLARAGHDVELLTGGARHESTLIEPGGSRLRWTTFPYETRGDRGIAYYFRTRRRIRSAYRSMVARGAGPHDIIVHNQPLTAAAIGRTRTPSMYIYHSPWPLEYLADRFGEDSYEKANQFGRRAQFGVALRRHVEWRALQRVTRVITLSQAMREHAVAIHGLDPRGISVFAGGVDVQRFTPATSDQRAALRARWKIEPDEFLLAAVRRLVSRTGVDLLLDALALGFRALAPARLLVAGSGPEQDALILRARQLGLDRRVRFLGYLPDRELPDLYRAADLAVMPTRALEGFGLATLEALACGTPVVATPVGGLVEILGGLSPALLASAVSAPALSQLIGHWVSKPGALAALGGHCRNYVIANYSWDNFATNLEREAVEISGTPPTVAGALPRRFDRAARNHPAQIARQ